MKKIIVTGGLGFIGSNLIELLLKKNFYVINIKKKIKIQNRLQSSYQSVTYTTQCFWQKIFMGFQTCIQTQKNFLVIDIL